MKLELHLNVGIAKGSKSLAEFVSFKAKCSKSKVPSEILKEKQYVPFTF